jgi:hypothetical protein
VCVRLFYTVILRRTSLLGKPAQPLTIFLSARCALIRLYSTLLISKQPLAACDAHPSILARSRSRPCGRGTPGGAGRGRRVSGWGGVGWGGVHGARQHGREKKRIGSAALASRRCASASAFAASVSLANRPTTSYFCCSEKTHAPSDVRSTRLSGTLSSSGVSGSTELRAR